MNNGTGHSSLQCQWTSCSANPFTTLQFFAGGCWEETYTALKRLCAQDLAWMTLALLLYASNFFFFNLEFLTIILVWATFIITGFYCWFFSSSRCLLNISCIFSIHTSILFLRSWIIFPIITLNSFSGRLPVSSLFIWSCGILPCPFICNIFLCHLILSKLLCLLSPFIRLQGHSSSCFWCLPLGGWGWSKGLFRLLGGRDCYLCSGGWCWVFSLWRPGPRQVECFGVSVSLIPLHAACLLMREAVFLSCWLFSIRCPTLDPASSCVGTGLGDDMDTSGSMRTD